MARVCDTGRPPGRQGGLSQTEAACLCCLGSRHVACRSGHLLGRQAHELQGEVRGFSTSDVVKIDAPRRETPTIG